MEGVVFGVVADAGAVMLNRKIFRPMLFDTAEKDSTASLVAR